MNGHHWTDGKWSIDKESIDSVTKTEANDSSLVSCGDFFITFPAYIAGRLKRCNPKLWVKSADPSAVGVPEPTGYLVTLATQATPHRQPASHPTQPTCQASCPATQPGFHANQTI